MFAVRFLAPSDERDRLTIMTPTRSREHVCAIVSRGRRTQMHVFACPRRDLTSLWRLLGTAFNHWRMVCGDVGSAFACSMTHLRALHAGRRSGVILRPAARRCRPAGSVPAPSSAQAATDVAQWT